MATPEPERHEMREIVMCSTCKYTALDKTGPDGRTVYVALGQDDAVGVIDVTRATMTRTIPAGRDPERHADLVHQRDPARAAETRPSSPMACNSWAVGQGGPVGALASPEKVMGESISSGFSAVRRRSCLAPPSP